MIEELRFFCRENPVIAIAAAVLFFAGLFYLVKTGSDTTFQPWEGFEMAFLIAASPSILLGLYIASLLPADPQAYRRLLAGGALTIVCYIIAYTIIDRTLPAAITSRFGTQTEMDVKIAEHTMISGSRLTRTCHTALRITAADGYDKTICTTKDLFETYQDRDHVTVPAMEGFLGRMPFLDAATLTENRAFRHQGS